MDNYYLRTPTDSDRGAIIKKEEVTGKATGGCECLVRHTNVTCLDHPALSAPSSLHRAGFQGLLTADSGNLKIQVSS